MKRVYLVFIITLITTLSFLGSCSLDRGNPESDLGSENYRAINYLRPVGSKSSDAKNFYEKWKAAFVKKSTTVSTQRYVDMRGNPPDPKWK